jgi:hypothetical protein
MHTTEARRRPRGRLLLIRSALLAGGLLALATCTGTREQSEGSNAPQPAPTAQPAPSSPPPPAQPAPAALSPNAPPQAAEVNDKLARIFQGAVRPDPARPDNALVGDFNGDGSQDIAVVARPDPARLADINSEFANWILNDPHTVTLPDPNKAVQKLPAQPPVKVAAGDVLLAVIHGYKEAGWRSPDAQQTYLLRNAVGRDLRVQSKQAAAAEAKVSLPPRPGDLIRADGGRESGFIYWAGAKYAWLGAARGPAK